MSPILNRKLYPAAEVLETWPEFGEALKWAKVDKADFTKMATILGDPGLDDFVELASLPTHLVTDTLAKWALDTAAPPLHLMRMAKLINVAKLKAGVELEDLLPAPPPAPAPVQIITNPTGAPSPAPAADNIFKITLQKVIDQGMSRQEIPLLPEDQIVELRGRFAKVMGGPPIPRADVTDAQLTALCFKITQLRAPYVDFGVWGPFGARTERELTFVNYIQAAPGIWQPVEQPGAPNLVIWRDCWAVFKTGAIMKGVATQSTLDTYVTNFEERCRLFPTSWHLCATADIRCRAEFWGEERRRQAEWHGTNPSLSRYDPDMPWDSVIRESAESKDFWDRELRDPGLVDLASRGGQRAARSTIADAPPLPQSLADRPPRRPRGQPTNQVNDNDQDKFNKRDSDGNFKYSRSGVEICGKYGEGRCQDAICPHVDPTGTPRAHICFNCRQPHRGDECRQKKPGRGGKGRGRGGRGGRHT